jgi:predicted nucleic-acid-binding protein
VWSLDTNVVVRLIVEDDVAQGALAEEAWRAALASGGVFLSIPVLIELGWVLRVSYRFDRATIIAALRRLIDIAGVVVEHETTVRRALDGSERSLADFSDHVILESARDANALPVLTFDERFARETDVRRLTAPP